MKILRNKIEFVVLVIIFYFNKSHAQSLIPIPESLKFGPKTHERIIVPHFDRNKNLNDANELQAPSAVKNVVERPNLRGRIQYDGRRNKPLSYVNRHDGRIAKSDQAPNEMQPLHIDTEVFDNSKPNHTRESKDDKRKRFKLQEERIKMKKLPENPQDIPTTTWFDNLGKYNYGIVHHAYNIDDVPTLENIDEPSEGESKEVLQPVILPSKITTTPLPEIKFKSSFRDPNIFAQIHSENDNMGKFLYKTQVYYPNYRDHVYLPVTTFYGDNQGLTKDLPVFNAHTIIHNEPPKINAQHDVAVHQIQNSKPVSPSKSNAKKPSTVPPKKTPPRVDVNKKEVPKKPVVHKPPPPPPPKKEVPSAEEDYDYEEDESEDDYEDDGANNDKYRGNSNGNDEEEEEDDEEEEEESEENNNRNKNSFTKKDSNESDEDQFDQAWSKFGYGQPNKQSSESDSYESSESQNQPERIKIVHMKMEVQTTPLKYEEGDFDENEEESTKRDIRSAEILEGKKKPRENAKREGAKNQAQHPNAGPDDLKFFQYLTNLGNGEHRAGGRLGNDKHYVEQHERGNKVLGTFQKKVKWADKEGGFGEHYWDLNHG